MAIVAPPGDHMPVYMRCQVTQAREVNLVRRNPLPYDVFGCPNNNHQMAGIGIGQIAHFHHMILPDDAAETGKSAAIGIRNPYDAAAPICP